MDDRIPTEGPPRPGLTEQRTHERPRGWGALLISFGLALLLMIPQAILLFLGFKVDRLLPGYNLGMLISQFGTGVFAVSFIFMIGGEALFGLEDIGTRVVWKVASWLLLADFVCLLLAYAPALTGDVEAIRVDAGWPLRLKTLVVICIGIGLAEEGVFRGLILNGLLARMGTTRSGMTAAVVISSFIFGAMHCRFDAFGLSALGLVQNGLKLLQAGMLGFFLAVIVVRTRNLWWAVVVHALNDFVLLFLSNGIARAPITIEYVSANEPMANIILYLIVYVLYIPMMVGSVNMLRESELWRGAFFDDDAMFREAVRMPLRPAERLMRFGIDVRGPMPSGPNLNRMFPLSRRQARKTCSKVPCDGPMSSVFAAGMLL